MITVSTRRIRDAITSAGSVVVHGVVLAAIAASSLLHVEPLAGPAPAPEPLLVRTPLEVTFQGPASRRAGPPPPRGEPASDLSVAPPESPTEAEKARDVVQPLETPQEIPQAETGIGDRGSGGSSQGFPVGSPFGIEGSTGDSMGYGLGNGPPGVFNGLRGLDEPRVLSGEVSPPKRLHYIQPTYPDAARQARAEGTVILEITIGRTGVVEEVKVLRSSPLFDAAAVEAVKRWKYEPATLGSRPVRVFMTVRVEFRLK